MSESLFRSNLHTSHTTHQYFIKTRPPSPFQSIPKTLKPFQSSTISTTSLHSRNKEIKIQ